MNNIKIKLKTSELTGAALDWAVARCELGEAINEVDDPHFYSTDWALGGPIIEQEKIELTHDGFEWWARIWADEDYEGPTPLIAAMRCYVASKLGDEVEVPDELKEVMA
jgi:photosystem II stability/assembly factor-like uncharacterized protein